MKRTFVIKSTDCQDQMVVVGGVVHHANLGNARVLRTLVTEFLPFSSVM